MSLIVNKMDNKGNLAATLNTNRGRKGRPPDAY